MRDFVRKSIHWLKEGNGRHYVYAACIVIPLYLFTDFGR